MVFFFGLASPVSLVLMFHCDWTLGLPVIFVYYDFGSTLERIGKFTTFALKPAAFLIGPTIFLPFKVPALIFYSMTDLRVFLFPCLANVSM